ncbi:macrophage erythroblast attacher isoform 1 [Kwoniella mangroviensis CBS 10435]|uniref:Macrophage erythroblast attacher isoform 1 n=1 Tax=Kwoniella mangroviensis CBS 10435 TaxID=1331196 RepID=A0A1B9IYN8_9TREE|nr:macrophage erythroblast attacher isoform 1 [Kwoniella mangroviensis CBS 10435]
MAKLPSSTNGALILEEPLIRTPYELLRRSHRSAQRQVEKDFNAVSVALQSIVKSLNAASSTEEGRQSLVNKLDQAGERTKGLKRKLDDIQPNSREPTPLRSRLDYLNSLTPAPTPPALGKVENKENGVAKPSNGDGEVKMEIDGEAKTDEEATTAEPEPKQQPLLTFDATLDRYIVDYLLRTGRLKTAEALAKKQSIEALVDIKLFTELSKIENALIEKKSCTEALAWCGENRGTLKKTKNNLEFTLRLQEFIELCRKRDIVSAIAYSRKNLAPWAATHMAEIQQGMTLMSFGERTGVEIYKKLYDPSRWQTVRDSFRSTFLTLYAQPSQPILSLALSAGLSSLRLPSCVHHISPSSKVDIKSPNLPQSHMPLLPAAPPLHNLESLLVSEHLTAPLGGDHCDSPKEDLHEHPDKPVGNIDCPTCDENLKVLSKELPMSHHVNSTIVCRISGKVMDSQNEPMAFPNGYVYSSKALREMADANFGVVTCPRTRDSCSFERLRKVYIS